MHFSIKKQFFTLPPGTSSPSTRCCWSCTGLQPGLLYAPFAVLPDHTQDLQCLQNLRAQPGAADSQEIVPWTLEEVLGRYALLQYPCYQLTVEGRRAAICTCQLFLGTALRPSRTVTRASVACRFLGPSFCCLHISTLQVAQIFTKSGLRWCLTSR